MVVAVIDGVVDDGRLSESLLGTGKECGGGAYAVALVAVVITEDGPGAVAVGVVEGDFSNGYSRV